MNLLAISHYRYRHYFLRTNSCECYCYIKGKECIKAVDVYCPGFTFNLSLCHLEFKASNPYLNCTKVSSISSLGKNTLWPNISHRTAFSEQSLPAIQETRVQSLSQEDPLEKGMTTRYSILAWRIPWTEKPGGLQSMGSQSQTQLGNCHFTSLQEWNDYYHSFNSCVEVLNPPKWWYLEVVSL